MKHTEFFRRLERRGARQVRSTGGHMRWEAPGGTRFTTRVAGRCHEVMPKEFLDAAKALGINHRELL